MSWGQWHYGQAELGTDTCHAGPCVGISVSPILSCCPCNAGGFIPDPFPCCSVMAAARSSLHSMAPSPAMLCHVMPCCVIPCHAVSHFAAHRPHCKLQVRPAQRCVRLCAHGMPPPLPTPRPRSRPPHPGRAGGTGLFPATCPHGLVVGEIVLGRTSPLTNSQL